MKLIKLLTGFLYYLSIHGCLKRDSIEPSKDEVNKNQDISSSEVDYARTVRVEIRRDPSSIIENSVNPVVQQNRLYSRSI